MQPCLANIFKIELAKPGKFAYRRIERVGLEEDRWLQSRSQPITPRLKYLVMPLLPN